MSETVEMLFDAARSAQGKAHAPYSGFNVGAAIRADDGQVYAGCNVENAAYPVGTCAEAGAIAAMIAGGGCRIAAIAIVGSGATPCFPCGACRQRILEFSTPETLIYPGTLEGISQGYAIGELLPHAFGPASLK